MDNILIDGFVKFLINCFNITEIIPQYFFNIVFSISILFFGFVGIFVNKRNVIIILVFFELVLMSVTMNFLTFSIILDMIIGQVVVLYVLCLAGSEVSIGLGIVILLFRIKGILNLDFFFTLKG